MIDRVIAETHPLHGEHREALDLVVVAGVVAEWAFVCHVSRVYVPLEDDFRRRRHLQLADRGLHQQGAAAAQKPREAVFRKRVWHRCDGAQRGGGICPEGHRDREGLAGMRLLPLAEIQGAAAVREPAHDQAVFPDYLHAVDPEILPLLVRAARDHQGPGDQRAGVARPAGLHRQHAEVDVVFLEDVLLALAAPDHLGRHGEHLAEDREFVPGITHAFGRVGLAQEGEQFAHLTQFRGGGAAHAERHALFGTEQIGQQRHFRATRVRE